MINQIKARERELDGEREVSKKLKRELTITMHKIEQMKAEAPRRAHKVELGNNFDQIDINQFFEKLYPDKNQASKKEMTTDTKGPWTKPCCIEGC